MKIPRLQSTERLEFLGDAVVGLAVAVTCTGCPIAGGEVASRAAVVSAPTLAKQAKGLQVSQLLRLGHGEGKNRW